MPKMPANGKPALVTHKITPRALQLVRLAAVLASETQSAAIERLFGPEVERLDKRRRASERQAAG